MAARDGSDRGREPTTAAGMPEVTAWPADSAAARVRAASLAAGFLLVALALVLNESWYQPLPSPELGPPPVSGWLLLRIVLGVEGLVLIGFGMRRRGGARIPEEGRLVLPPRPASEPSGRWWIGLAAVTLLGLVLRLVALNTDLWLDEIATVVAHRDASAWQVVTSYRSTNNHMLNTLLVKLTTGAFGEQEWAVRLPAVVFGVATVPALGWVARQALSPGASLGAALLLAVSYHHIFFSQNARGYTAYLLVGLVSSALLAGALHEDRMRLWAGYVAVMTVGFAALLTTGFVFAGHLIAGVVALAAIARQEGPVTPMLRRLAAVFAAAAACGLTLYVVVLPQAYVLMREVYRLDPAAGYPAFSREFAAELARGLSAGFGIGSLAIAVPLAAVAVVGYVHLLRRNWPLVIALTAPLILTAAFFVVRGFVVSPRHFLLGLPLAVLVAMAGVERLAALAAARAGSRRVAHGVSGALVGIIAIASLASLPPYYATPKQAYREALAWVASAASPGDAVVAIHYAAAGVSYYGDRIGWEEGRDFFHVRSVAAFEQVLAAHPGRASWLLVTFPRALRLSVPDLDRRLRDGWTPVREFSGTIGDGTITIWHRAADRSRWN